MVPIAVNADRLPDDEAGTFVRTVLRTTSWPQGVWVVAPDGRVLAFHYFRSRPGESPTQGQVRWVREMLDAIDTGLKAFGNVGPRHAAPTTPLPFRGRGVRPDGGVRLAVAALPLHDGRHDGPPAIDSIGLPADAWAAFRPPRPAVGTRWELPGPVARSFAPALSPLTDSLYTPRPGDVTAAALRGEVEAVSGALVLIRLSGHWSSAHDRDGGTKSPVRCAATADGLAEYDTATGQMRSVLLVFQGTFQTAPPGRARATGAVAEWRAAESASR